MQSFFENSVYSNFIKNLLSNTYLPTINTVSYGDYMIEGVVYIAEMNIVLCTKSGIYGDDTNRSAYTLIDEYEFGALYESYTEKFISRYDYYDSETHKMLGKYLRCLRDIKGLNLMPLYNCYAGETLGGLTLELTKDKFKLIGNDEYTLYCVPIKFNTNYTIAFDCAYDFKILPMALNPNKTLVKTSYGSETNYVTNLINEPTKVMTQSIFTQPFIYRVNNYDARLNQYEKYLNLVIQVPSFVKSSLVVLEGDYTSTPQYHIVNHEYLLDIPERELTNVYRSKLSLLQLNDGVSYPYSDRLIEYLLYNVICSIDEISPNVGMVQKTTDLVERKLSTFAVWDNRLRHTLFNRVMSCDKIQKLDILGYVDNPTEDFINKGYTSNGLYETWLSSQSSSSKNLYIITYKDATYYMSSLGYDNVLKGHSVPIAPVDLDNYGNVSTIHNIFGIGLPYVGGDYIDSSLVFHFGENTDVSDDGVNPFETEDTPTTNPLNLNFKVEDYTPISEGNPRMSTTQPNTMDIDRTKRVYVKFGYINKCNTDGVVTVENSVIGQYRYVYVNNIQIPSGTYTMSGVLTHGTECTQSLVLSDDSEYMVSSSNPYSTFITNGSNIKTFIITVTEDSGISRFYPLIVEGNRAGHILEYIDGQYYVDGVVVDESFKIREVQ